MSKYFEYAKNQLNESQEMLTEAFNTPPYDITMGKKGSSDIFFTFTDEDEKEFRIQFYSPQGIGKSTRQVFIGQKKGAVYPDAIQRFKNPMRVIATMIEATKQFLQTPVGKNIDGLAINFSKKALERGIQLVPKIIKQSDLRSKLDVLDLSFTPVEGRAFVWCVRKGKKAEKVFDGPKMEGITWDNKETSDGTDPNNSQEIVLSPKWYNSSDTGLTTKSGFDRILGKYVSLVSMTGEEAIRVYGNGMETVPNGLKASLTVKRGVNNNSLSGITVAKKSGFLSDDYTFKSNGQIVFEISVYSKDEQSDRISGMSKPYDPHMETEYQVVVDAINKSSKRGKSVIQKENNGGLKIFQAGIGTMTFNKTSSGYNAEFFNEKGNKIGSVQGVKTAEDIAYIFQDAAANAPLFQQINGTTRVDKSNPKEIGRLGYFDLNGSKARKGSNISFYTQDGRSLIGKVVEINKVEKTITFDAIGAGVFQFVTIDTSKQPVPSRPALLPLTVAAQIAKDNQSTRKAAMNALSNQSARKYADEHFVPKVDHRKMGELGYYETSETGEPTKGEVIDFYDRDGNKQNGKVISTNKMSQTVTIKAGNKNHVLKMFDAGRQPIPKAPLPIQPGTSSSTEDLDVKLNQQIVQKMFSGRQQPTTKPKSEKVKITVTAFNNFVNFDKISAALGAKPQEAQSTYNNSNDKFKINDFYLDIQTFLSALKANGFADKAFTAKLDDFTTKAEAYNAKVLKKHTTRNIPIPALQHEFPGFSVNVVPS